MKRKYLFRGKRMDNGEWVEGFLISEGNILRYVDSATTWDGCYCDHKLVCRSWEVDPKTVGQWIGVKGYKGEHETRKENEVMIWEGDIVEARSEGSVGIFVITWRQQSAPGFILWPAWQSRVMWNIHALDTGRAPGDYYDDLRVLGNIHDNPELISKIQL